MILQTKERLCLGRFILENKVRQIYKENFAEYLLCLALDVGEGMLKNGGEVSRVEETIERICKAYGAMHVEVFSIISMINATVRMPDGSYSAQMRRVKHTNTNLGTLERLNALSREVCATTPALDEFEARLYDLKHSGTYRWWVTLISMISISSGFTLFFGGTWRDALVAGAIGAVTSLFEIFRFKYMNAMAKTTVQAFVISLLAGLSVILGLGDSGGTIIIGSIMFLVPGLSFGTAMRDLLCGDLASGSLRTLQAVLQALMIAFGYTLAVFIVGGVI